MLEELAVARIGAQFNDLDAVDGPVALAQAVPVFDPGIGGQFLAQADHGDVAFFLGPGLQLAPEPVEWPRAGVVTRNGAPALWLPRLDAILKQFLLR